MPRKPNGDKALTAAERMQASRRRQREREREAVDNPASADDATLARLITRTVASLEREQTRSPATAKMQQYLLVKYGRELCNRYASAADAFLEQLEQGRPRKRRNPPNPPAQD